MVTGSKCTVCGGVLESIEGSWTRRGILIRGAVWEECHGCHRVFTPLWVLKEYETLLSERAAHAGGDTYDLCNCCGREFMRCDLSGYTLSSGAVELCEECGIIANRFRNTSMFYLAHIKEEYRKATEDGTT